MSQRRVWFAFCAAALGACDTGKLPVEEGLEREEIGTFTTDADGIVRFDVEPAAGAISALVYCGPYDYDREATARLITAPDGSTVYDRDAPTATAMRVDDHAELLPILLPVSPDLDLAAGTYGFEIAFTGEDATSVTCNAVYRTDAAATPATVDLNVVFVGVDGIASGLTAAEGATTLASVLDTVATIWDGANLEIGTVTYEDFAGNTDDYTVVTGQEALGALLRTANPDDERAITVFLVQEIVDDAGSTILGFAGGPPGLAAVGGTSKSGIVVSAASFTSDPDEMARTIAHEGGHFLGLFHTSDKDGLRHDPLADTPECTSDPDGNGIVAPNECEGTGAENLMFWSNSETAISADQGWVLARSAATH